MRTPLRETLIFSEAGGKLQSQEKHTQLLLLFIFSSHLTLKVKAVSLSSLAFEVKMISENYEHKKHFTLFE